MRHKWWRLRARETVVSALVAHLSSHEARQATEEIFDALEGEGLRIMSFKSASPVRVVGWGPIRMPGERAAWAKAELRAREMLESIEKDKDE